MEDLWDIRIPHDCESLEGCFLSGLQIDGGMFTACNYCILIAKYYIYYQKLQKENINDFYKYLIQLKDTWNHIFYILFLLYVIYNMYINMFSSLEIQYKPWRLALVAFPNMASIGVCSRNLHKTTITSKYSGLFLSK